MWKTSLESGLQILSPSAKISGIPDVICQSVAILTFDSQLLNNFLTIIHFSSSTAARIVSSLLTE